MWVFLSEPVEFRGLIHYHIFSISSFALTNTNNRYRTDRMHTGVIGKYCNVNIRSATPQILYYLELLNYYITREA